MSVAKPMRASSDPRGSISGRNAYAFRYPYFVTGHWSMTTGHWSFSPLHVAFVACACLCVCIPATGCKSSGSGTLRKIANIRASDIERVLRPKDPVKLGNDFRRKPIEQIVDDEKVLCGYLQEERYPLLGDVDAKEARIYMVYDSQWHRRGFVTGEGAGYVYGSRGDPIRLQETGFVESVKFILNTQARISFEAYKDEGQVTRDK